MLLRLRGFPPLPLAGEGRGEGRAEYPARMPVPNASVTRRRLLHIAAGTGLATLLPAARADELDAPVIEVLPLGTARLELQFAPGFDAPVRAEARAWVERSAAAVIAYLGRFPVPRADLLMLPFDGAGVRGGMSFGEPSPYVRVRLGRETERVHFLNDWVLVHEMVHLAIPALPRTQRWLHEGLATYVESVARTRAGIVPEAQLWGGLAQGMPQGQPKDGDEGLDHTHTWGRTYWGGAMFCLLADVQMRRRSGLRAGLQQALQGLLAAGGNYGVSWPVTRVLAAADASVGQTTLAELYELLKDCPRPIDLDALWHDLGVQPQAQGTALLHDDAPLAGVRRAIVT